MSKSALDNVPSNRCNVPNVENLTMRQKSILFPFEWVPQLRRLILEYIQVLNVSIDSHLEYVSFYIVDSRIVLISADFIQVWNSTIPDQSFPAIEFSDDYTCQELNCDPSIKLAKSMESLVIAPTSSRDDTDFVRRHDLKSLCIKRNGSLILAVLKNVEKLRILDVSDPALIHFRDTAKLEYIEYAKMLWFRSTKPVKLSPHQRSSMVGSCK